MPNFSNHIDDGEFLYRRVVEQNWDNEKNRPSSAIFKDSNGVSVDRQGNREDTIVDNEVLNDFFSKQHNFKAVVKVKARKVREIGAIVIYKPEEDNVYHSEIHRSCDKIQLSQGMANQLRDCAEQIYP